MMIKKNNLVPPGYLKDKKTKPWQTSYYHVFDDAKHESGFNCGGEDFQ